MYNTLGPVMEATALPNMECGSQKKDQCTRYHHFLIRYTFNSRLSEGILRGYYHTYGQV